jgi:hypothetical protein
MAYSDIRTEHLDIRTEHPDVRTEHPDIRTEHPDIRTKPRGPVPTINENLECIRMSEWRIRISKRRIRMSEWNGWEGGEAGSSPPTPSLRGPKARGNPVRSQGRCAPRNDGV